jgi:hypothetical protein
MNQLDAGHHHEQFTENMRRRSISARDHIDFARVAFRIADELGNGSRGHFWIHHDGESASAYASDRRNVADEVETEIVVEGRDRVRCARERQRVAIGQCTRHKFGAEIASGAGAIVDNNGLACSLKKK